MNRDVRYRVDLVSHLAVREFRLRYRRSVLGWTWAILVPLARLVVLAFVFTEVIPLDIDHYPAFLYTGLLAWTWFSSGVLSVTTSIVDRSDLVVRPGVPRAAVPLTAAIGDTLDYVIALPLLLGLLAFGPGLSWSALALLPLGVAQFLLIIGIGALLAPLHVHVRDVARLVEVTLVLGFYATPVFYDRSAVPDEFEWVIDVNPMAWFISAQRDALVDGRWPSASTMLGLLGLSVAVAVAAVMVFRRVEPNLADEL